MARRIDRRQVLKAGLVVAGGTALPQLVEGLGTPTLPAAAAGGPTPWPAANDILAGIQSPQIPVGPVFDVTTYGAVADGHTDNTDAFARAIAACSAAGGGQVMVPAGTYLSGAIHLLSKVDFHLAAGAIINFSSDVTRFPLVLTRYEGIECMNHSPMVYAYGQSDIALTGSGILDASQTASWNTGSSRAGILEPLVTQFPNDPSQRIIPQHGSLRSTFVEPYNCSRVLLQGVTLRGSRFWQFHPTRSNNVTVDGVTTTATTGMGNTDGCNPESCDTVVIKNSNLRATDDCIAIKSGRDADGRRLMIPSTNIVVWNNTFTGPFGGVTCGSEMTGGISNVYAFQNSGVVRNPAYVKSNTLRGGYTRNYNVDTYHAPSATGPVFFVLMNSGGQTGPNLPQFSDLHISNFTVSNAPSALSLSGLSGNPVQNVTVLNSTFTGMAGGLGPYSNVTPFSVHNVTVNGTAVNIGPPVTTPSPSPSPTQPPVPTNVQAVATGGGGASVTWTPAAGATGYAVYAYSPSAPAQLLTTANPSSIDFTGLTPGVYYTFTVTGWTGSAWTAWSAWAPWVLLT